MQIPLDSPQEEEYALANMTPHAFYHHWSFPQDQRDYFHNFVLFDTTPAHAKREFIDTYRYVMQAATYHAQGKQLIVKSPANSGRIPLLLDLFPNAKFIHIYRNPYDVYYSTVNYYKALHPLSRLQPVTDQEVSDNVLYFYDKLMHKLFQDIALIPSQNFAEIQFEQLEQDFFGQIEQLYNMLRIDNFNALCPILENEAQKRAPYRKNKFTFDDTSLAAIQEQWAFTINRWHYEQPTN